MYHLPLVDRITDFVKGSDEVIKPILFKSDAHVKGIVRRSGTVKLPSARDFVPGVPHPKVLPSLRLERERLGGSEMGESEDESRSPEHGDDSAEVVQNEERYLL